MTAYDILENLGLDDLLDDSCATDKQIEALEAEIEVHFQPSYPLKGSIGNVRWLKGIPVLAVDQSEGYGDKEAWELE